MYVSQAIYNPCPPPPPPNGVQNMDPPVLEVAFRHIDAARRHGKACLVHCKAGTSRSCSLVLGYLMQLDEGMSLMAALAFCQAKRRQVRSGPGSKAPVVAVYSFAFLMLCQRECTELVGHLNRYKSLFGSAGRELLYDNSLVFLGCRYVVCVYLFGFVLVQPVRHAGLSVRSLLMRRCEVADRSS